MSNHDIGLGLSQAVKAILRKHDEGKIDVDTARELLQVCRTAVNFADGNEIEAVISMHQMRCGYCLKKMSEGDKIYSIYDTPWEFQNQYNFRSLSEIYADWYFCEPCFDLMLDKVEPGSGPEMRKSIETNCSEECWHYKDNRRPWEIDD